MALEVEPPNTVCFSNLIGAALNNKAHILFSLEQHDAAREVLTSLWLIVHNRQCDASNGGAFRAWEIEGFTHNILFLLAEIKNAPAA